MAVDTLMRLNQQWQDAAITHASSEQLLLELNQLDGHLRLLPSQTPVTSLAHLQVNGLLNSAIENRCAALKTDPATACSLWFKLFNAHLLPSLTMMLLSYGRVPVLSAERLGIELNEYGDIKRLSLVDCDWISAEQHGWEAAFTQFGANLSALLTPLQEWSRNDYRLAKSVFWGNVAFALAMGPVKLTSEATEAQAEDLQGFIDSLPIPSHNKVRLSCCAGRLVQQRATCCLKYKVPGKALCGTCCLDKAPRSTSRLYVPQEPNSSGHSH